MTEFTKHLYLILYPNEALVASQLTPDEFGMHYSVGSPRHFKGKVIFVEVDIEFRHPYLRIDEYLKNTESGIPDRPKRTKFVKSYRVLEHVEFSSLQKLYLVTTDGGVLGLEKSTDASEHSPDKIRLFQEICPLRLVVASNLLPAQFGHYITAETWSRGAPKIFYTRYDIDVAATVEDNAVYALGTGPLPNINPTNLPTALKELQEDPSKKTKTVSLNPNLDFMSYKSIKDGFWFSAGDETVFYKMPGMEELREKHRTWWRLL